MQENQSQITTPDLTNLVKSIFSENKEFDLNKNPNEEKYFEPVANGFYGFAIEIPVFDFPETLDIDHIDITNQKLIL